MWSTETPWFDLAMVFGIFAFGNVLFGHFEEHKPKARRVLKVALVAGATVALSAFGLRWVAFTVLGLLVLAATYVHAVWLPRHGVHGWTGEPRDRYYELLEVPEGRRPLRDRSPSQR